MVAFAPLVSLRLSPVHPLLLQSKPSKVVFMPLDSHLAGSPSVLLRPAASNLASRPYVASDMSRLLSDTSMLTVYSVFPTFSIRVFVPCEANRLVYVCMERGALMVLACLPLRYTSTCAGVPSGSYAMKLKLICSYCAAWIVGIRWFAVCIVPDVSVYFMPTKGTFRPAFSMSI